MFINNQVFITRFVIFTFCVTAIHFILESLYTIQFGQSFLGLLPDLIAIKSGNSPKNDCPNCIVYRLSNMKWIAVTQNVKMTNLVMKTWLFINIKNPLLIHCCELFHSDWVDLFGALIFLVILF